MNGKELLERLTELLKRYPELEKAEVVCPIVDEEKRKERSTGFWGNKTGLPYENFYAITEGAGQKCKFLILWPKNELAHEPKKKCHT